MKKIFLFLIIVATLRAQYTTPNSGVNWNLDSLVIYSGGVVTGSSPSYTINNKVIISATDLVSVFAGTTINFVGTTSGIEVNGRLKLLGSNLASVTLTSATPDSLGAYDGLRFNDTSIDSECVINYAVIEYAYYGVRAIDASPTVTNSIFHKCRRGFNLSGSNAKIYSNLIRWSYEYGITMTLGSSPEILGNHLLGNNTQNTSAKNQISIGLQGNNSPIIKNNTIQGSTANTKTGGISLWVSGSTSFSNAVIENNIIFDNVFGITLYSSSSGVINSVVKGNHIYNNKQSPDPMTGGSGINVNGSSFNKPIITRNLIHDNWWGITIQNGTTVQEGPQPNIGNTENIDTTDDGFNKIYDNIQAGGVFDLYNNCTNNIYAQNNDWGVYDSAAIENHIFHKVDNAAHGTVFFMPFFDPSSIPVELISFTASFIDNRIELNWSTATETNNRGFEIHCASIKGNPVSAFSNQRAEWKVVGFVEGNKTTSEKKNYTFADNNLSAGKYIYRLKQIDFDGTFEYSNIIEVDITLPSEFVLHQNYPNPFNPVTNIKYTLPENGIVTLSIYNLLGEKIVELVNEMQTAGEYSVEFNAEKFASGNYVYRLNFNGNTITKKMTILK